MKSKICSKCELRKPRKEFNKKSRSSDGLQAICRECQRAYKKEHYENNKDDYLKKSKKRKSELKQAALEAAVSYLEDNPCVDCGESDVRKLHFDHMRDKQHDVSQMIHNGYLWETIEKEIAKCEVRCANCHMVKTWPDRWKIKARSSSG